jgi:very-short-patch-repair endonuclease
MARLIKAARLPVPSVELSPSGTNGYRLDFCWPEALLTAEVDGFGPHSALQSFEADMLRGNRIRRDGWLHLQYSWRHVTTMPSLVVAEIGAAYQDRLVLRSICRREAV